MTFSSSNLAVATIIGNTVTITGVGSSEITARQAGNPSYSPGKYVRSLSVSKGSQTISFNTIPDKTLGDPDFTIAATSSSGLPVSFSSDNPAVATVDGNTVHLVSAGTATIRASQPGNSLWNPAPDVLQSFTVNKADQTITFNLLPDKTYGDPDFTIAATSSSGLPVSFSSDNPAVATVDGNTVHLVSAGTATIRASQAGNNLWNPAPDVLQSFTVNKADQTITFNPLPDKTYGDPDFSITAIASSGLPVSFSSDNPPVATVDGNTVHLVSAGTATIRASQAGNNLWNPAPDVLQSFTVNKADQVITFTGITERLQVNSTFTLLAASTSGLEVLFESADTEIATVEGNLLTGISRGSVQVRAYNEGNNDYNAAEIFATVEVYSTHVNIMYLFTPDNDGFNDCWEIPEMSAWGNCKVRVYNRWGKLVYANNIYNNKWDGTSNGSPLPEGAYFFIIETDNNGVVKGNVNIVR
jgi:gliding motility-associated-like protein